MREILIFTDGGSYKNSKVSKGYDAVSACVVYENNVELMREAKFLPNKTNNYAEMHAIANGLYKAYIYLDRHPDKETIKDTYITVVTDSQLCQKSITEWIYGWMKNEVNGIMYNSKREPVANQELVKYAWTLLMSLENDFIKKKVRVHHINSHRALKNLSKDRDKFNKKNKTNLSLEEYKFYYMSNILCDKMVEEKYNEMIHCIEK